MGVWVGGGGGGCQDLKNPENVTVHHHMYQFFPNTK